MSDKIESRASSQPVPSPAALIQIANGGMSG